MCAAATALPLPRASPGSSDLHQPAAALRMKRQTGLPSMLLFLGSWVGGCWAVAAAACDESQPIDSNESVQKCKGHMSSGSAGCNCCCCQRVMGGQQLHQSLICGDHEFDTPHVFLSDIPAAVRGLLLSRSRPTVPTHPKPRSPRFPPLHPGPQWHQLGT
jgi:hypothetical protein